MPDTKIELHSYECFYQLIGSNLRDDNQGVSEESIYRGTGIRVPDANSMVNEDGCSYLVRQEHPR